MRDLQALIDKWRRLEAACRPPGSPPSDNYYTGLAAAYRHAADDLADHVVAARRQVEAPGSEAPTDFFDGEPISAAEAREQSMREED